MALTQNELHLLRAVTLAVFKSKWEKNDAIKEKIIARTRGLKIIYKPSPEKLIKVINLYSAELTNEEMNSAYEEILEIFQEMRTDLLNL